MVYYVDSEKKVLYTSLQGKALLFHPLLNKGTAFSAQEREHFALIGKLPAKIETLEEQIARVDKQLQRFDTQDARSIYLHVLFNTNEMLFYAYVKKYLMQVVSTLYTPTVGKAVQIYSEEYRHPRGIYISLADKGNIKQILATRTNPEIDLIVISDGEGVLGIGDQGLGGMGIPVAKLVMYIVSGCCSPLRCLPIFMDVGTNNQELLANDMYLGLKQKRLAGDEYNAFVDEVFAAIETMFPTALVHWEDFAKRAARRHLTEYSGRMACFNDDIQGTAVVVIAAILTGLAKKNQQLNEQRIVIVGAGSAGIGIANLLLALCQAQGMSKEQAQQIFWVVDRYGLIMHGQNHLSSAELTFARESGYTQTWQDRSFATVVEKIKPTILIGCSTVGGFFDEKMIKNLVATVTNPIIMPLSNPSTRSEAHPHDLYRWSDFKAYVATGSPFPAIEHKGAMLNISQCNNLFAFPGIGAGMIIAKAKMLTDKMLIAGADAIAKYIVDNQLPEHAIMPDVADLEQVSHCVAQAVAKQAVHDGVTDLDNSEVAQRLEKHFWQPAYLSYAPAQET